MRGKVLRFSILKLITTFRLLSPPPVIPTRGYLTGGRRQRQSVYNIVTRKRSFRDRMMENALSWYKIGRDVDDVNQ